jgi:hypothetical protein
VAWRERPPDPLALRGPADDNRLAPTPLPAIAPRAHFLGGGRVPVRRQGPADPRARRHITLPDDQAGRRRGRRAPPSFEVWKCGPSTVQPGYLAAMTLASAIAVVPFGSVSNW